MNGWTKRTTEPHPKGPEVGASVPMEMGCTTLPAHRRVHQPGSSTEAPALGISWQLHYISVMDPRFHFQPLAPLPSPENRKWS